MEIAAALSRNIPVIPVLLDGTTMPTEEELPESLWAMRKRNGVEVSSKSFTSDMDELISAAKRALGEPMVPSKPTGAAISQWRSFAVYSLVGVLAAGALALIIYAYKKFPSSTDSAELRDRLEAALLKPSPPKPAVSSPSRPPAPEEIGEESEPNNTASSANTILFGSRVQGVMEPEALDVFTFRRVILRKMSSRGFWASVAIYDKNEQLIKDGQADTDRPVSLVFDSTPNSTYLVSVKVGIRSLLHPEEGTSYELEIRAD